MLEKWPGQFEYELKQLELEQMHADYEAMDQAEYAQFMDEMDEEDRRRNS